MSKLDVVSIRLVKDAPIMSDKPIGNPIAAVELLGKQLCDMDREVLCVINLKANGVPINCNFVSMGAVFVQLVETHSCNFVQSLDAVHNNYLES